MYKSPIEMICEDMKFKTDRGIFQAVQNVGVEVNKEELIKALKYDRRQYDKGFADGYKKAKNDFCSHGEMRCKDCKHSDTCTERPDNVLDCEGFELKGEYISKEKFQNYIKSLSTHPGDGWSTQGVLSAIDKICSEDVAPVKYGKWVCMGYEVGLFGCNLCEHMVLYEKCNYCPNCGAKMT